MKKIILPAVLCSALIASAAANIPVSAANLTDHISASDNLNTADSGKCGDNLTWTLKDGTLTISGSGDMATWQIVEYVPWHEHASEIRNVVLDESVTLISRCAFADCSNLSSINIPAGLTAIAAYAFKGCSSLTTITVPPNVEFIGNHAFQDSGLQSIVIEGMDTEILGVGDTVNNAMIYTPEGSSAARKAYRIGLNYSSIGAPSTPPPATTAPPVTTTVTTIPTTTTVPVTTTAAPVTTTVTEIPTTASTNPATTTITTTTLPATTTIPATTTEPVTTTLTITTSAVESTTVSATEGAYLAGDANANGRVELADALLILQHVANSKKYEISPQGVENADVYCKGDGITAMDALSIQKYDAKLLTSLPESYLEGLK